MSYIPNMAKQKCCVCQIALRNKNKSKNVTRIGEKCIEKIRTFSKNETIKLNDLICSICRTKAYKAGANGYQVENKSILNTSTIQSKKSIDDTFNNDEDDLETIQTHEKAGIKKIELYKAPFTKKHCFVCKKKSGLHLIKPESMISAYKNYGILIQKDSRCCTTHFDNNGDLKYEEYLKIRKLAQLFDKAPIELLDICILKAERIQTHLNDSSGIFDKFRDMASIEENICKQVTGWSKLDFVRFSGYIKNVRDTAGRTKEQLIAIYRYWLMKGLDQTSLALMKCNTSQQQISHYLDQIRSVMNEEFVPKFLGAHKGKDFFLKHNTESVKILHDFDVDTLAVIADGTYTRLEKSANNEFQYSSFSKQKTDHLIKPFIMCCADGYFIDCYGPFAATLGDSEILKYILNTDEHLRELFKPADKIMMFLDRGLIEH
jgi:hypothetical protein